MKAPQTPKSSKTRWILLGCGALAVVAGKDAEVAGGYGRVGVALCNSLPLLHQPVGEGQTTDNVDFTKSSPILHQIFTEKA